MSKKTADPKALAQQKIEQALAAVDANVVDLARALGPDVVTFLTDVLRGNSSALDLREGEPVPVGLRLAAADLLRKIMSLPTNLDIGLKQQPTFVYTGQPRKVKTLPAEIVDEPAEN